MKIWKLLLQNDQLSVQFVVLRVRHQGVIQHIVGIVVPFQLLTKLIGTLLGIFEGILRADGNAIVVDNGTYRIVPSTDSGTPRSPT